MRAGGVREVTRQAIRFAYNKQNLGLPPFLLTAQNFNESS